jgi:hypothetical protein
LIENNNSPKIARTKQHCTMDQAPGPLHNVLGFSEAQRASLALAKAFVGTLSTFGSMLLMWHTGCRLRSQPETTAVTHTYYRLLFAMSLIDAVCGIFTGTLNTVLVDAESGGWGSYGNRTTCSLSGFWNQFQTAVPLYSASLAIYFWINVRFGVSKGDQILVYVEPILHLVPCSFALATAALGVHRGWFNAQMVPEVGCWIEGYPVGRCRPRTERFSPKALRKDRTTHAIFLFHCFTGCHFVEGMECTRGPSNAKTQEDLIVWMSFWPLIGACFIVFAANLGILAVVVTREIRMRRHTFDGQDNRRSNRQIRTVAFQNFLYVAVVINTILWVLLAEAAIYLGGLPEPLFYPLFILYCFSFPSQGIWNFLVYIRMQYLHLRRRQRLGRCLAIWEATTHPLGPAMGSSSREVMMRAGSSTSIRWSQRLAQHRDYFRGALPTRILSLPISNQRKGSSSHMEVAEAVEGGVAVSRKNDDDPDFETEFSGATHLESAAFTLEHSGEQPQLHGDSSVRFRDDSVDNDFNQDTLDTNAFVIASKMEQTAQTTR